jgi:hypothetical protein
MRSPSLPLLAVLALLAALVPSPAAASQDDNPYLAPQKIATTIGACIAKEENDQDFARRCTESYVDACEKAGNQTTVTMSFCRTNVLDYWKNAIAKRTAALLARRNPQLTSYVLDTQNDWKHYTQSRCKLYGMFQGTLWGPLSDSCALDIALGRAEDLHLLALNMPPYER